jgi:hypothetical protein
VYGGGEGVVSLWLVGWLVVGYLPTYLVNTLVGFDREIDGVGYGQ